MSKNDDFILDSKNNDLRLDSKNIPQINPDKSISVSSDNIPLLI